MSEFPAAAPPPPRSSAGASGYECTRSLELSADRRQVVRERGDRTLEVLGLDPLRPLAAVERGARERSPTDEVIAEAEAGGAALEETLHDAAGGRVALILGERGFARTEVWDLASRARLLSVPERAALSPDGRALFTFHRVEPPLAVATIVFGVGLLLAMIMSFRPGIDPGRVRVNEGIRRSLGRALVGLAATLALVIGLFIAYGTSQGLITRALDLPAAAGFGALVGAGVGVAVALVLGGFAAIGHGVMRVLLALAGDAPLAYARFLDRAAERALLRRVGGGYVFVHRVLAEYFAEHAERRLAPPRERSI